MNICKRVSKSQVSKVTQTTRRDHGSNAVNTESKGWGRCPTLLVLRDTRTPKDVWKTHWSGQLPAREEEEEPAWRGWGPMKMSLTHSNDERAPWPVSWPHLCPRGTKEQHACCPVGVTHVTDHHQWHKSFLNYESQKLAGCTPSPKIPSWAHGSLQLPTCFAVWLGLPEWVWPTNDGAVRLPSGPRAAPHNCPHSTSPSHGIKREGLWESLDDRNLYPLASLRRRNPPGKPGNPH